MQKPQIVSPWWSYNKAMAAAVYWADAVYVWVPFLSLRMRQNKIKTFQTLKKTIQDLHKLWKKAFLTVNIFPRNSDIKVIEEVIEQIQDLQADSVIFSDPWVYNILRKYLKNSVNYHLSTQTNTLNYEAVKFWADLWVDRIVLARELNIKEIAEIKKKVPNIELEAFVHWAMCIAYSGRCLLGEYFSGRDWNKWECSHVCRYKFSVYVEEDKRPWKFIKVEEDRKGTYLFSSKDLCTIDHWKELFDIIDAWKIEWRSKSELYVASITKAYSHLAECLATWKQPKQEILQLVNLPPHRFYWDWFLFNDLKSCPDWEEDCKIDSTTKTTAWPIQTVQYIWFIEEEIIVDSQKYYKIVPKHNIQIDNKVEVLQPSGKITIWKITNILNENKQTKQKATCNDKYVLINWENIEKYSILYKDKSF